MNNISKAQQGRIDKVLNTKIIFVEGLMTRKEWLHLQHNKGSSVREVMKSKTKYNRIRFNRMNYEEQQAYEARINKKVPCYELVLVNDDGFYDITKIEFDYFNTLLTTL